jgi:hypothetical protein
LFTTLMSRIGLSPGAQRRSRNGNYRNGEWTAKAIEEQMWLGSLVRAFAKRNRLMSKKVRRPIAPIGKVTLERGLLEPCIPDSASKPTVSEGLHLGGGAALSTEGRRPWIDLRRNADLFQSRGGDIGVRSFRL